MMRRFARRLPAALAGLTCALPQGLWEARGLTPAGSRNTGRRFSPRIYNPKEIDRAVAAVKELA